MIKVKKLCRLNGRQREEIRELEMICKENDGTKKSVYLSTDQNAIKNVKCFFLYYENEMLAGFLAAEITDEETAEVYAFVHPKRRHRGIFSRLLDTAKEELEDAGINDIYLLYEPAEGLNDKALLAKGATYCYAEYMLSYQYPAYEQAEEKALSMDGWLREVKEEDQAFAVSFLEEVFSFEEEEAKERFAMFFDDTSCTSYVFEKEEVIAGYCSIFRSTNTNTIFDLGIRISYQGKGNGTKFLALLLQKLKEDKNEEGRPKEILLQTGSYNERAVALYQKAGFIIKEQICYYEFE